MIIDTSYFFGDILIGQLSEQSVQDKLTLFINQFEPEILQGLLGYETYKKLIAVTVPIEQRWTDLKNGKEYIDELGVLRKWNGLVQSIKVSLIAYYVYYWYQRSQATTTSGTGEGKTQTQNAIPVSPVGKMVNAWNKMVNQNIELYRFLNANKEVYTEWYDWAVKDDSNIKFFHSINSFNI